MNVIIFITLCSFALAKVVTVHNDILRTDTNGNIIDCHSGNVIRVGNTYYMYGEYYGNSTGFGTKEWPKLRAYTSPDLVAWEDRGFILMNAPIGTYFTPNVIYNEKTQTFVAWFNAYTNGCCDGSFGVAKSSNGISFEIVTLNETPYYPKVDCNGLFVDDDGTAYVIYSSLANDHQVSIEKLTPDYLHTTKENYGLFPDHYVEGSALFKRNGIYYVAYGSCCCFCRAGSGTTVYSATKIQGPWSRQGPDVNCNTTTRAVCGKFGEVVTPEPLIISAQIISIFPISTLSGTAFIWLGERWLSAPHNNPSCPDECRPTSGICQEPPNYIKGNGYTYWYPLQFDQSGKVLQFRPFVDSFQLDI